MSKTAFEMLTDLDKLPKNKLGEALAQSDGRLKQLIAYALHPNVVWLLPKAEEGENLNDLPISNNRSVVDLDQSMPMLLNNVRKLYIYCKREGDALSESRRQTLFLQLLDTIHPDDGQLLLNIKDGIWPFKNINLALCKKYIPENFPNL